MQDCRYCIVGYGMRDCMDTIIHNVDCQLDYEAVSGGKLTHCLWNTTVWGGRDMIYCDCCFDCASCFGCIGLRNKQYCILNKQYTKEEYEALVPQIIARIRET